MKQVDGANPAAPREVVKAAVQRVRHLRFMHEGFKVTVLSVELATAGPSRRFQSGFTIESHLETPAHPRPMQQLVFDTHTNALRHGRADAKRCIADLVRDRVDIALARGPYETPEAAIEEARRHGVKWVEDHG